jgi:hypothetical protein
MAKVAQQLGWAYRHLMVGSTVNCSTTQQVSPALFALAMRERRLTRRVAVNRALCSHFVAQGAEEAVRLVVDSGREEEGSGRTRVGAVAEG